MLYSSYKQTEFDTYIGKLIGNINYYITIKLLQHYSDTILYKIVSPVMSPFRINNKTGLVYTRSPVTANSRFTLIIEASDGQNSNTMTLTIRVTAQSPRFVKEDYGILIMDTTGRTETILVLEATAPLGSDIKYAIVGGNSDKRFGIHSTTGLSEYNYYYYYYYYYYLLWNIFFLYNLFLYNILKYLLSMTNI